MAPLLNKFIDFTGPLLDSGKQGSGQASPYDPIDSRVV